MQHLQKRQEIEEIRRRSASFMRFEADFRGCSEVPLEPWKKILGFRPSPQPAGFAASPRAAGRPTAD
jgi:hypothetical protein